jgi:hypothetical protein
MSIDYSNTPKITVMGEQVEFDSFAGTGAVRLHIDRRDDPWLVPELAKDATDEVRTEASFHAHDAGQECFEGINQRKALDLATERDLACRVEGDEVKDVLADIDADRGKCGRRAIHELLLLLGGVKSWQTNPLGEAAGPFH